MGIHYDYKSKRGERAMLKEAKRKARLAQKRAKRLMSSESPEKEEIRIARRKFVDSMREMADAERVNLRDVNSAYANQAGVPALQ